MLPTFIIVMHLLGVVTSIRAVMSTRTSQGAIAWAVCLNTFPYLAVPAYWVFGQSKFDGYDLLRRNEQVTNSGVARRAAAALRAVAVTPDSPRMASHIALLENLSQLPITTGNAAKLLVDGEQTFDAILDAMEQAKRYILFQFYILRDDGLGQRFKEMMLRKVAEGVSVYALYDELGSKDLSAAYCEELRAAGVEIAPFNTTQGKGNRFRVNFRNHRKVVVVDGSVAFVGGHNVGDDYLGLDPKLSPWRDTHVQLRGPVVKSVQVSFVEDWYWAKRELPDLDWEIETAADGDLAAACVPSGPADKLETGTLMFLHGINSAQDRIWIVSPYFVPDEQLMSALQLAALRGVDVRILIPQNPDALHVYLSSISYLQEAEDAGVKIYRYQPGFLHQKVALIDKHLSSIGTANLDNRSMRLNFEITMLIYGERFAGEVEKMLLADFAVSKRATPEEYTKRSFPFRLAVRICRLFAPLQ
ncbi:cardiolipin synthase [Stieleria sp. TO1_6]|uniref:cardiolipin synthase n=1 Tax=Stieleria tagensis TaxID=2956795 RepID=UPI00209AC6FB|nr:cardiolipin synthase [Stieleria tagensis]MCO8124973.1 cardiolipin synthase [Stieleria tagensis]